MSNYKILEIVGCALQSMGHALYQNKFPALVAGVGCALGYFYITKSTKERELVKHQKGAIKSEVLFFPDSKTIDLEMSEAPREKRGMMYKEILYDKALKEGANLQRLMNNLTQAKRSIDVCLFNITSEQLTQSVVDTIRQGVKVRLIVDGSAAESSGSQVGRFRGAGAFVRSSKKPELVTKTLQNLSNNNSAGGDGSDYLMHHKFAIVDGATLITGSFNWTMQALMGNKENVIITSDPLLVQPFYSEFEKLWAEFDPQRYLVNL